MIRNHRRDEPPDESFVDHCAKITCTVCSFCGGPVADVDLVRNVGRCLNAECECRNVGYGAIHMGVVTLAPAPEAIYGELSIRDGGTGEQADGSPSASVVMGQLQRRHPRGGGSSPGHGLHEWSLSHEINNLR